MTGDVQTVRLTDAEKLLIKSLRTMLQQTVFGRLRDLKWEWQKRGKIANIRIEYQSSLLLDSLIEDIEVIENFDGLVDELEKKIQVAA